jgi:hypothetical protein
MHLLMRSTVLKCFGLAIRVMKFISIQSNMFTAYTILKLDQKWFPSLCGQNLTTPISSEASFSCHCSIGISGLSLTIYLI